jgi:RNA polymerase sigma factor (sigma-70 family)
MLYHLDDRELVEAEREARAEGRVLEGDALNRDPADVLQLLRPNESERQLILAARDGNASAFEALIRRHWERVYTICLGFTGNRDEAKELAQEACFKVWQARQRLDPNRNFGAYLAKTAENHCTDWWRRQKRLGPLAWSQIESIDVVLEDEDGEFNVVIDEIADPTAPDPEYALLREAVERVLKRLIPIHRSVLWQRFVIGHSRAKIAEMEGCTQQNVGYHERRARQQFCEFFKDEWGKLH